MRNEMDLLFVPHNSGPGLQEFYHRALQSSVELYILSAYLTEWDTSVTLGKQCKSFAFIVGKDFGITRKAACQKVINWLPKARQAQFLVAELLDGFHPKAMFWREANGSFHALVGSSNLSKAAFASNHEINGYSEISEDIFVSARAWILKVKKSCVILNQSWLEGYQEAVQKRKPGGPSKKTPQETNRVFNLKLPPRNAISLQGSWLDFRRSQMLVFDEKKEELQEHFKSASRARKWSEERNEAFYYKLRRLWDFGDGSRFQANGWERQGKSSNFRELSRSIIRVIEAEAQDRDEVVMTEIDRLTSLKVSTRKSVFTEMLCQFFPDDYHLDNEPVSAWLRATGCKSPHGASAGYKYLEAAHLLRAALANAKSARGGYPVENLGVLDSVIWYEMQRNRSEI